MNIPVWLLRLLPIWDYICPKCKREVKQKTHKCSHCGENYGVPLRVPLQVLEDPKALESYVHQKIFSRVSASQREYLTQFFTTIFSDGWETAQDFTTNWTASYTTTGETATVVSEDKHHGTYSAKFTSNGGGGTEHALCYKTGFNRSEVYGRCYVKVTQNGIVDNGDSYNFINFTNAPQTAAMLSMGWAQNLGVLKWRLRYYNGASIIESFSTGATRDLNVWYCVEIYWLLSATAGVVRGYVDGVMIFEFTGLDTDNNGNMDVLATGLHLLTNCASCTDYVDCVVLADTYIGPDTLVVLKSFMYLNPSFYRRERLIRAFTSFIALTTIYSRSYRRKLALSSFISVTSILKRSARQRRQLVSNITNIQIFQRKAQQQRSLLSNMTSIQILRRKAQQRRLLLSNVSVTTIYRRSYLKRISLASFVTAISVFKRATRQRRQLLSFPISVTVLNKSRRRILSLASTLALVTAARSHMPYVQRRLTSIVTLTTILRRTAAQHRNLQSFIAFATVYRRQLHNIRYLTSLLDFTITFRLARVRIKKLTSIIAFLSQYYRQIKSQRRSLLSFPVFTSVFSKSGRRLLFLTSTLALVTIARSRRPYVQKRLASFLALASPFYRKVQQRRILLSAMVISTILQRIARQRRALRSFINITTVYRRQLRSVRYYKSFLAFMSVWYRKRVSVKVLDSILPIITVVRVRRPYVQKRLASILFMLTLPQATKLGVKLRTLLSLMVAVSPIQRTLYARKMRQLQSLITFTTILQRATRQRRQLTSSLATIQILQRRAQQRRTVLSNLTLTTIYRRTIQKSLYLASVVSIISVIKRRAQQRRFLLSNIVLTTVFTRKRTVMRIINSILFVNFAMFLGGIRHYYTVHLTSILAIVSKINLHQICVIACSERRNPAIRRKLYGWSVAKCLEVGEP